MPSGLRVGVGAGVLTLFRLNAPILRSAFGTLFLRVVAVQLEVLVDLLRRKVKGGSALLVSRVVVGKKPRL